MRALFVAGDQKVYSHVVTEADQAAFNGEVVHPVCSTFALAQYIEWSSRLFVLEMKEPHEEGIGTQLTINHKGPAFVGETLEITATVESLNGNELVCRYEARAAGRLVAQGITGQKVLPRERITQIFSSLQSNYGEKGH